jgi:hypothetical protein
MQPLPAVNLPVARQEPLKAITSVPLQLSVSRRTETARRKPESLQNNPPALPGISFFHFFKAN